MRSVECLGGACRHRANLRSDVRQRLVAQVQQAAQRPARDVPLERLDLSDLRACLQIAARDRQAGEHRLRARAAGRQLRRESVAKLRRLCRDLGLMNPVARAVWKALPNLAVAAVAWILAGGAHHTVYSQAVTSEQLRTFAEIFGIEFLLIGDKTEIPAFKNEIVWNECAFGLRR